MTDMIEIISQQLKNNELYNEDLNTVWCAKDDKGNFLRHTIKTKQGLNLSMVTLYNSKKEALNTLNAATAHRWVNGIPEANT